MNATVKVIRPSGILDGVHAGKIRQEIGQVLESGAEIVLIDLENITFIDSSGLGALAMAFKSTRAAGGRLCFCSLKEQPRMLFELTGMEQIFEIFLSQDEFNQAISNAV
jgi:anti-sigma B factor antagonist